MTIPLACPKDRTLLPFRHLQWRSSVVALLAAAGPAVGATLWLALQGGDLLPALIMTGLLLTTAAVLTWRVGRAKIVLLSDGLRVWTPRRFDVRVARARVRRAVLRSIHAADGLNVSRHLFLLDDRDRSVFRMSDRWWSDEQISRVARHFEVPMESLPEAVYLSELRRTVPQQLFWTERHVLTARLLLVAVAFAGCLAVGWLATASL